MSAGQAQPNLYDPTTFVVVLWTIMGLVLLIDSL